MKKYSVCEAFRIAKEDIKILFTLGESSKYILLVNNKHPVPNKKGRFDHLCYPVLNLKPGRFTKVNSPPMFNNIPSVVQHFSGRQKEICQILAHINENRLVNILGPPGIGKTALSWMICNNIIDRNKFYDGIIYVDLRGIESIQMLLTNILLSIQSSTEGNEAEILRYSKQISLNSTLSVGNDELDPEVIKTRAIILQCLRNKEVLIVLDG